MAYTLDLKSSAARRESSTLSRGTRFFYCRLSSVVEQCFCKAWVVGSNPTVGSQMSIGFINSTTSKSSLFAYWKVSLNKSDSRLHTSFFSCFAIFTSALNCSILSYKVSYGLTLQSNSQCKGAWHEKAMALFEDSNARSGSLLQLLWEDDIAFAIIALH